MSPQKVSALGYVVVMAVYLATWVHATLPARATPEPIGWVTPTIIWLSYALSVWIGYKAGKE